MRHSMPSQLLGVRVEKPCSREHSVAQSLHAAAVDNVVLAAVLCRTAHECALLYSQASAAPEATAPQSAQPAATQ